MKSRSWKKEYVRLQERMVVGAPAPTVGMGATMTSYSRHAGTIIKVEKAGKGLLVHVQQDNVKRIDSNGISKSQDYEFSPNTNGSVYYYKQKEPNCRWVQMYINPETGRFNKKDAGGLFVGERDEYYDFSF